MLKQHGHPLKVAHQYREQPGRGLISPVLFPLYWFTLRAILVVWVTIRVIVVVFALQGTSPVAMIALDFGRDVLLAGIIIPAGVTLLFAVWEYLECKFRYSENGSRRLWVRSRPPCPRPPKHRPMVQIIGGIAWLIFWALALYSPWFFWVWGGRGIFSPSEALYATRFPLWLLAFFGISQSWLVYTRFAAGKQRQVLRIGVVGAGVALAIFLLQTGGSVGRGSELGPHAGQVVGDSESDDRGRIDAGLHPCGAGTPAEVHPHHAALESATLERRIWRPENSARRT